MKLTGKPKMTHRIFNNTRGITIVHLSCKYLGKISSGFSNATTVQHLVVVAFVNSSFNYIM